MKIAQTNTVSMFQWIYHTNTKNSLHRAQSLQVTKGQGVEAKAKAKAKAKAMTMSSRSRAALKDQIPG